MDEAISPELVLVCPELRTKAIAALPDPDWDRVLARVRLRAAATAAAPAPRLTAPGWAGIVAPLVVSATFFAAVVLATLTLTLLADTIAVR